MDLANMEVTQSELAQILPITDRHLRNLKKSIPSKGKRGTSLVYNLREAVLAFIQHLEDQKDRYTSEDVKDAKARKEIASAIKEEAFARSAQVQAAKDEGAVALVEDVRKFVTRNNERLKSKLIALIPSRANHLVGIKKPETAQDILMEMANTALAELSEWKGDELAELEASAEDGE